MITEDYVSFETAKLLKEKGFDGCCTQLYNFEKQIEKTTWPQTVKYDGVYINRYGYILCPTLQMAMKWLREVHNIAINTEWEHLWYAYVKPMTADYYQCESSKYEEACEAAIKYCLENLI